MRRVVPPPTLVALLMALALLCPLAALRAEQPADGVDQIPPNATATFTPHRSPAEAKILGPSTMTAGSTAFLKLSESADWVSWIMFPTDADASFMSFQNYLGMSADGKPIIQHLGIFSTVTPGTYWFSVAASGQIHVSHKLVVTERNKPQPDPEPEPKPEPEPEPSPNPFPVPPANIFVLVLAETGDRTPEVAAALSKLRGWLADQKIKYRIEDPDLVGPDNNPAEWLRPYKDRLRADGVALPALFIGQETDQGSVERVTCAPLPVSGDAAIAAVEARIEK